MKGGHTQDDPPRSYTPGRWNEYCDSCGRLNDPPAIGHNVITSCENHLRTSSGVSIPICVRVSYITYACQEKWEGDKVRAYTC